MRWQSHHMVKSLKRPTSASADQSPQWTNQVKYAVSLLWCPYCVGRRVKRLSLWQRVKHRMFLCEHLTSILLPAGFRRHMTCHVTSRHWCRLPTLTENECLYKANAAKQRLYVEYFSPIQSCVSWLAPYSEAEPTPLSLVLEKPRVRQSRWLTWWVGPGLNEGVSPLFAAQRDILRRAQRLQCDTLVVPCVTVVPPPWAPPLACDPWRWC